MSIELENVNDIINPKAGYETAWKFRWDALEADGICTLAANDDIWYHWRGTRYEEISKHKVEKMLYEWLSTKKVEAIEKVMDSNGKPSSKKVIRDCKPNDSMVRSLLHSLNSVCLDNTVQDYKYRKANADTPKSVIPFRNGLLNLDAYLEGKIEVLPHTPRYFNLAALDRDFEKSADCPQWLAFLEDVFDGDKDSIRALQQWFGYNLTSDTSLQKIHLWQGQKRAGKGTCSRVLEAMLGQENVAWPTLDSLGGRFGLQPLVGTKAVIIGDAGLGRWTDARQVANILKTVSGEDKVTVDRKSLPALQGVRLHTKITMIANDLPTLQDASGALASRFVYLKFPKSFYGNEDTGLEAKLLSELPGITLWGLEGLKDLKATGKLVQPSKGEYLKMDFEEGSSYITAFVRECCEVGEGKTVDTAELFNHYRAWADQQNIKNTVAQARFGQDLHGYCNDITKKRGSSGDRQYKYTNIALLSPTKASGYLNEMVLPFLKTG